MWGIASNEDTSLLESFRDVLGLSFPILDDADGSVHHLYAQEAGGFSIYPQDWIIGADGTVVYVNNGYEPDEWVAVLEQQLDP